MRKRTDLPSILILLVALSAAGRMAQAQQTPTPVKVELVTRAVSKTPVLIAYDRCIYKKYGLDVKLWLTPGEFPGAIEIGGNRMESPDISVDGGVPMVNAIPCQPRSKAATDCNHGL